MKPNSFIYFMQNGRAALKSALYCVITVQRRNYIICFNNVVLNAVVSGRA